MAGFTIFGNVSTVTPVNWQPEPNMRGTWNILSSCLITLGLCLWTALHLNIPEHRKDSSQKWRKLGWLVLGTLAPEMVAYTAWYQRRAAVMLTEAMKTTLNEPAPSDCHRFSNLRLAAIFSTRKKSQDACHDDTELRAANEPNRRNSWTMTHSFYAVMGGFAFDTERANPNFLPDSRSRLCLNPKGLIYMAEKVPTLLPDIPKNEIQDKSKASGLAKILVCAQALWFCVQCITRLAQHYAIGLLELNVFGHALCALLIYAFWWHKPLDISEPTLIVQVESAWELCALMCTGSSAGAATMFSGRSKLESRLTFRQPLVFEFFRWHKGWLISDSGQDQPHMNLTWDWRRDLTPDDTCMTSTSAEAFGFLDSDRSKQAPPRMVLREGETIYGFNCKREEYTNVAPALQCTLDSPDLRRLQLLAKALQKYYPPAEIAESTPVLPCAVFDRIFNWPSSAIQARREPSEDLPTPLRIGFTIAGCIYGGLHLLAWNAPFASTVEQILWRCSAMIIVAAGPVVWLLLSIDSVYGYTPSQWYRRDWRWVMFDIYWWAGITFFIVLAAGYVIARVYLVVECFLQLARLPQSTYQLPAWSQYFPHIA